MGTLLVWAIGIPLVLFGADVPIISQLLAIVNDAKVPIIGLASAIGVVFFGLSGVLWGFNPKMAKTFLGGGLASLVVGVGGPALVVPYLQTHLSA